VQSETGCSDIEAKNTSICRLFGRFDYSRKGCQRVLLSDNNLADCCGSWAGSAAGVHHRTRRGRPNQLSLVEIGARRGGPTGIQLNA
jgi:hypothetical protein